MKPYYSSIKVLTREKKGLNIPYNLDEVEVVTLPNRRIACEGHAIRYLSRIDDKSNYDVLCGTWHPEAPLALFAGFRNVFILGHGAEFTSGGSSFRENIWIRRYAKSILNRVKLTIANSNFTKELVNQIASSAKCVALPLGVNHHFFKPSTALRQSNQRLRICTVSRIEQFKGHDFIARVIFKIQQAFPGQIEWHIAGTGRYLNDLRQIIENLGIQDFVVFHGFVKDYDLPSFYNANDLFILCTRENPNDINVEGFGLVFLEAQACGIPAIGTKTGGISDAVIPNNGGWLITQDDESELFKLLISLINNRSLFINEGLKARKRVEQACTWEIYCKNLAKLLLKY
jgi:phosphatidylinositol alpha-1,6-mannosyltransferase